MRTGFKWLLASPFLLFFAAMITFEFYDSHDEAAALRRARALGPAGREAIMRTCQALSREIGVDEYEREFSKISSGKPIPKEFAALAPIMVTIEKSRASIKFKRNIFLSLEGLDSSKPKATLSVDEVGNTEPWAALESAK